MKSLSAPRPFLFLLFCALVVLIFLYRPADLKGLVRASSQGTVRTETIRNFGSSAQMDYHILSMGSDEFRQVADLLSTLSCRKKLNQKYSAYSHQYPVQSVTVSFYGDAEDHKFLLTVYSDGV